MITKKVNFVVYQGTTFSNNFYVVDANNSSVNISGYTARSSFKLDPESNTSYSFTASTNSTNNFVTLSLTANASGNVAGGRYLFDILLVDGSNNVYRSHEGILTMDPQVTV